MTPRTHVKRSRKGAAREEHPDAEKPPANAHHHVTAEPLVCEACGERTPERMRPSGQTDAPWRCRPCWGKRKRG